MKRNAKTIIAGMIALAISHTAMADDIKVAVVGAMSGPIAQWGDMEFNGARQAIKDINAKGGIKGAGSDQPGADPTRLSTHYAYCRAGLFPGANGGKIHS